MRCRALACRAADGDEVGGLQGGTADQAAVDVGLGKELGRVVGLDAAAVDDAHLRTPPGGSLQLGAQYLVHVLGLRRRRNTALPMWNGQAPGPGPDLVPAQRQWLAVLMVAAVLGWGAAQWADAPDGLVPLPSAWFQGDRGHDDDD